MAILILDVKSHEDTIRHTGVINRQLFFFFTDHPKSPKGEKKDAKGGKEKVGKGDKTAEDEEENLPPPPLEVSVRVKLIRWQSAIDSVKPQSSSRSGSGKTQ